MTEEQMDKLIKNAAEHYNVPPANPPLEQMWAAIETETFGREPVPGGDSDERKHRTTVRASLVNNPWLRMAAVLVLGVVIGRATTAAKTETPVSAPEVTAEAPKESESAYELTTERYLGQTVTLFASLPNQLRSGGADTSFVRRANESLGTLRVLTDSPAANNPRMRALFEDIELVLVQVVQMPERGSATDAKLIRQAMQQRDVMPRLFDAVAETPNF